MAGWGHMENQEEIRKAFVIYRDGVFFRVRNVNRTSDNLFTTYHDAEIFVDKKVNELYNRRQRSFLRRAWKLHKITDLRKRCKEYRKLLEEYK